MADSSVAVTPGTGAQIDARSQPGGDLRQVVTIGDGDATPIALVDSSGLHVHTGVTGTAPTPTRVAAAITSTQLLAANSARKGLVVHNDSSATLRVKFGTAASATSYIYALGPGAHLSLPDSGCPLPTGVVHGIWTTAVGAATLNEVT